MQTDWNEDRLDIGVNWNLIHTRQLDTTDYFVMTNYTRSCLRGVHPIDDGLRAVGLVAGHCAGENQTARDNGIIMVGHEGWSDYMAWTTVAKGDKDKFYSSTN